MNEIIEPTPDDCGRVLRAPDGREYWASSSIFPDLASDDEARAAWFPSTSNFENDARDFRTHWLRERFLFGARVTAPEWRFTAS